jgi:hypothetical protein
MPSSWSVTTKLLKDFWSQIHAIALKATFMDNKLESTLFQFVWEQMSGSSVKGSHSWENSKYPPRLIV